MVKVGSHFHNIQLSKAQNPFSSFFKDGSNNEFGNAIGLDLMDEVIGL